MNRRAMFSVALAGAAAAGLLMSGCSKKSAGKLELEIAGEDIDGQPMKLSDFRGQVVLLDFWGNW
jgi:hypothetical protein